MKAGIAAARRRSAAASWSTVRSRTLTANYNGWQGYTVRQRFDAAGLANVSATQIRFTFTASTTGQLNITKAYIGLEGATDYDFAATPVQLLFGGNPGALIASSNALVSDAAAFSYDGTADLVLSLFSAAGIASSYRNAAPLGDGDVYYKVGDDAATVGISGYVSAGLNDITALIEVM